MVRYERTKTKDTYKVYYDNRNIGSVRYTPEGPGIWTFEGEHGASFGSCRLMAVSYYVENFMERGEGNNGKEEQHPVYPFLGQYDRNDRIPDRGDIYC